MSCANGKLIVQAPIRKISVEIKVLDQSWMLVGSVHSSIDVVVVKETLTKTILAFFLLLCSH